MRCRYKPLTAVPGLVRPARTSVEGQSEQRREFNAGQVPRQTAEPQRGIRAEGSGPVGGVAQQR